MLTDSGDGSSVFARAPDSIQALSAPRRFSRFYLLGLLIIFAAVWFSNLEYRKLVRPDEGRYAEIAREMALSGDWVTPRLNDLKYFEKPPLQYWATAAAFRLFGEHHWTARWWPATTTFACVLLMFCTSRRLYGDDEIALAAAAALGGCTGFVIDSHIETLDAGLAAFLTVALLGFLLAQRPGATPAENRNGMLARRLLLIWAGFIFLFFSASHSKLPSYILPVFPALALFAAVEIRRMAPETLGRFAWMLAAVGGALLLVVLVGGERIARAFTKESSLFEIVRNFVPWMQASIFAFTACAVAAAWLFRRYARSTGIVALAFGSLVAVILAMDGHDELSRLSSSYHIVREFEATQGPLDRNAPFFTIEMHDQTLPFYLKQPVTLVQYMDEFALGLAAEPDRASQKSRTGSRAGSPWNEGTRSCTRIITIVSPAKACRCGCWPATHTGSS